jgi:hypothetical protein
MKIVRQFLLELCPFLYLKIAKILDNLGTNSQIETRFGM